MKTSIHLFSWTILLIGLQTLGPLAFVVGWAIQRGFWVQAALLGVCLYIFWVSLKFMTRMVQKYMDPE